jgi:hypothetical protein
MEELGFSETLIPICETTQCHILVPVLIPCRITSDYHGLYAGRRRSSKTAPYNAMRNETGCNVGRKVYVERCFTATAALNCLKSELILN